MAHYDFNQLSKTQTRLSNHGEFLHKFILFIIIELR